MSEGGHMKRIWKPALLLTGALMLIATVSLSQELKGPKFTAKDRELIEAYYNHIIGTLAPGSLDRSSFPPEVERALVVGGHIPMGLENELERLPDKLESQLSEVARNYGCYKLGRHVILMKKEDRVIADILKNVALKQTRK
jgi:hypothetical protein